MPKTKISEFSVTPGDNTDIDGINIDEGCSPANLNNALRELMSQLKDFQVGNQTSNQLDIAGGGTGATTASGARTNLGLGSIATQAASSVAITGGSITGITDLALADGGTGASTAIDARTNLGLGTMATQASTNVSITGGSVTGITDIAIADGGTGASDAATARTNLNVPTRTGGDASGTWGINITGNAATATSATSATSATTATSATSATTAGNITGVAAVANGGTGASSASSARTNLGLAIGSDIPSNTGTGASGTWGISITGNAATISDNAVTSGKISSSAVTSAKLDGGQSGSAPIFAIRAWVYFDGTGSVSTNMTIRASGNVTSVYKNGTGDFTITFTTALPNSNYAMSGMMTQYSSSQVNPGVVCMSGDRTSGPTTQSTTQVRILTVYGNVSAGTPPVDFSHVGVMIIC